MFYISKLALLFLATFLPFWGSALAAQVKANSSLVGTVLSNYNPEVAFIDTTANRLAGNNEVLKAIFEKMYRLKTSDEYVKLSIYHIGDSHLQAGFLSGAMMNNFHRDFGNAGRGLILPLKLARTNEPFDYTISSTSQWKDAKCTNRSPQFTLGLGGISLYSISDDFNMTIKTTNRNGEDYSFKRIKLFHNPDISDIKINTSVGYQKAENKSPFVSEYKLNGETNLVTINGKAENSKDSILFYGASLENDKRGVLYHAVGLNGAQYLHYAKIPALDKQIKAISPDLILLSLGTNEAFRGVLLKKERLESEIDRLVAPIRAANPNAVLLFTIPPECQIKRTVNNVTTYVPNTDIAIVREAIISYANKHHCVYWDLYDISGGFGSSNKWVESNMLAKDLIHFQVAGYRVQGNLLYQAIINSYNEYVRNRNK